MGKSPGRWIKTVLFGKKYSKSNLSKTAGKTPVENLAGNPLLAGDLPYQSTDRGAENMELEKVASGIPHDATGLYTGDQSMDSRSNIVPVLSSDAEMRRLDQSATKAQAAFRGYLARRAFRALKGIIRLQALIRGHLVRRQAVSTLRCMRAIIKFQALARGRRIRLSDTRSEGCKKYNVAKLQDAKQVDIGAHSFLGSEKLTTNAFVLKLLAPSRTAVPLSLQYDLAEPNSAWNWLERWSLFHFSESFMHSKTTSIKPQRKQVCAQNVEIGTGKSKRTIRRVSTPVNGDTSSLASGEIDKPKRNPRKVTSHQTDLAQEQTQSELERVKRNLRKVSASAALASEKSETESEKPLPQPQPQPEQSAKIVMKSVPPDVSEQKIISSESPTASDVADKVDLVETPAKITVMDELVDAPQDDHPVVELHSLENGGKESPTVNEELISKEEQSGKENQKIRKRRSLPAKQEYPENISQNTPSLPSYMAATESAKAKLRAQESSKFDEDGADYGYVRRHSLPASTNGKLSSLSPRVQKPVQANGKGGIKTNRSLTASRDDKVLQPGWRR